MSAELLEQLNRFTRREHTEDEVYIFSVILCDNETDRDGERFSLKALEKMRELSSSQGSFPDAFILSKMTSNS